MTRHEMLEDELRMANTALSDAMKAEERAWLAWCAAKELRRKADENRARVKTELAAASREVVASVSDVSDAKAAG